MQVENIHEDVTIYWSRSGFELKSAFPIKISETTQQEISDLSDRIVEKLKIKPKVSTILSSFKKLSKLHETILVEGMGGVMTPILKDYYITDLIKDMNTITTKYFKQTHDLPMYNKNVHVTTHKQPSERILVFS